MRATVLMLGLVALAGCQDAVMSNDRMTSAIAGTLGVPPSEVTVVNRRTDGPTNTFVTVQTRSGRRYACTVNGGSALSFGIINPPTCNPAAS